jgi:hypothetical protein
LELPGKIPDALAINRDVGTNGRSKNTFGSLALSPATGLIFTLASAGGVTADLAEPSPCCVGGTAAFVGAGFVAAGVAAADGRTDASTKRGTNTGTNGAAQADMCPC